MNAMTTRKPSAKELSSERREELLGILEVRFAKHMNRHKGLKWTDVQSRLEADAGKLWSLGEMERTGGEPDVVGHDKKAAARAGQAGRRLYFL